MKLEVGMYVRTNLGITKIDKIDENKTKWRYYVNKKYDSSGLLEYDVLSEDIIKKASKNIIDLIEVGDYVNGYKVVQIGKSIESRKYIITEAYHKINYGNIFENEIETILTKEQFERGAYKI